jgi:hypothetical protein
MKIFIALIFLSLSGFSFAACQPSGTQSPHNPTWCYTGSEIQGWCQVVNCKTYKLSDHSNFRPASPNAPSNPTKYILKDINGNTVEAIK